MVKKKRSIKEILQRNVLLKFVFWADLIKINLSTYIQVYLQFTKPNLVLKTKTFSNLFDSRSHVSNPIMWIEYFCKRVCYFWPKFKKILRIICIKEKSGCKDFCSYNILKRIWNAFVDFFQFPVFEFIYFLKIRMYFACTII